MSEPEAVGGEGWREVVAVLMRGPAARAEEVFLPWQMAMYWEHKDVAGVAAMSRVCIAEALAAAERVKREGAAEEAKQWSTVAKKLAYNLASFTWTGWREEGVTIGEAERVAGLEAAKLNLRLARELERPPRALANALWVLGAQYLAAAGFEEAMAAFETGSVYAQKAGDALQERMLEAFGLLSDVAAGEGGQRGALDAAVAALEAEGSEDATEYARQLRVATDVFVR